jgi:hypothetical protein
VLGDRLGRLAAWRGFDSRAALYPQSDGPTYGTSRRTRRPSRRPATTSRHAALPTEEQAERQSPREIAQLDASEQDLKAARLARVADVTVAALTRVRLRAKRRWGGATTRAGAAAARTGARAQNG